MNKMWISRSDYHHVISAGLKTGELDFVEKLAANWLEEFPGDIRTENYLSKVALLRDDPLLSAEILTKTLTKDPENIDAYELLFQNRNLRDEKAVASFIHVLSGRTDDMAHIFPWAITLRAVRNGIRKGELIHSETLLRKILTQEKNNPLAAIEHCRLSLLKDENGLFGRLAESCLEQWPGCVQFLLFRAIAYLRDKDEINALNLLHQAHASDPEGVVIERLLGKSHEFFSLWDSAQALEFDYQIPATIAVSLKWNLIGAGPGITQHHDAEGIFEKPVLRTTPAHEEVHSERKGMLQPVYVILTTHNGLVKKYGEKTADFLIENLEKLRALVENRPHWESIVFLPDDFDFMQPYGLLPVNKIDPWQIKLAIHDLDSYLRKKSTMIGAILIVGGHEIVPFHHLPNPTDDSDRSVPSDNPYGTCSGNYLMQEWPVGRLPDEAGPDAGLLLEQIRQISHFHTLKQAVDKKFLRIFNELKRKIDIRRFFSELFYSPRDFGYSAAVWRRSSLAAFRPIGKGSDLRVSPLYDSDTIDVENMLKAKCAYFNLHGLADTPDWYGQRDFGEEPNGPDFPMAISAHQIEKIRNNIDLVFSEACYGAVIQNKTIDSSMALKLVSVGSQGFVGSTCIAYGSVFTPLIGADLLGFIFWKYIKEGFSFGEALLQAKLGLIKVMTQRQGYLDGEDQKTLLSFILYGDPLGALEPNIYLEKESRERNVRENGLNAFSDQDGVLANSTRVPQSKAAEINEMLQSYIPSINNADVKIREHQVKIRKLLERTKGTARSGEFQEQTRKLTQVQYSQKTRDNRQIHEQFVRVTLDESDKVVKFAVSR